MNLNFIPESDEFIKAASEYNGIWQSIGNDIISAIENITELKFKNILLEALVYEGISQSHPLKFRSSYDIETKKATLVHELLHLISSDYMLRIPTESDNLSLGLHKQIDLVLYDLWVVLFGNQVADNQVKIESKRTPIYKEAWEWALSMTKEERSKKFAELLIK